MNNFFENAIKNADENEKENFYKAIIMNAEGDYAQRVRIEYYKNQFKSMGENVYIGKGVNIINPQYISVGNNVQIHDGVTLVARGEGGITLGDEVRLQHRVYLDTESAECGYITIGEQVYIGTGTTLFGHKGLEIGAHSLLAQNITLTPYSHKFENPNETIYSQGGNCKKVAIGRDVYVGMGCNIMYSGDIGEGSVIGAGSTVVKPIPPYSVAVGTPAKVIKKRD